MQLELVEAALKLGLETPRFSLSHPPIIGCLKEGESILRTLPLKKGLVYTAVAVCEKGPCEDIDLIVLDDSNRLVVSDTGPDARPRVDIRPGWDSEYLIRIIMAKCDEKESGCSYAVGIFSHEP